MKAITIWQPWASAIACGSKRIETRGWVTAYRGPLLIHAAKREPDWGELIRSETWAAALQPLGVKFGDADFAFGADTLREILPLGMIVARCDLVDVRPVDCIAGLNEDRGGWTERQMGDYSPGRHGWILENVQRFEKPIPLAGKQSIFDVPDEMFDLLYRGA